MSAILTVSSAVIDVDGRTVVVTFANNSGNLVGAAVTGITFADNAGIGYPIVSAAVSAATQVTCLLSATVKGGLGMKISAATGSNLVDGAGNTIAASQTNITVTNNSTKTGTNRALSSTGITQVGKWTVSATDWNALGTNSQINFSFNGTGFNLKYKLGNTSVSYQVSIDGGTFNNIPAPTAAGAYHVVAGTVDQTDATHNAAIRLNVGPNTNNLIEIAFGIEVIGTAMTVAADSTLGNYYDVGDVAVSPYRTVEGGTGQWSSGTTDGYPLSLKANITGVANTQATNQVIRWAVDTTAAWVVYAWMKKNGQKFQPTVNGVDASTVTDGSGNSYNWTQLFSGASVGHYDLEAMLQAFTGTEWNIAGIRVTGGTMDLTHTIAVRTHFCANGDSNSDGSAYGGDVTDGAKKWPYKLCRLLGWSCSNQAKGGTQVYSGTPPADNIGGSPRTNLILAATPMPKSILHFSCGTNDLQNGVSLANFETAVGTWIDALVLGDTSIRHYITSIMPNSTDSNSATRISFSGKLQTKIAAVRAAGATNIHYIDMTGRVTFSYYNALHIDAACQTRIASFFAPYAFTSGVVLSGATTGSSGVASGNITVTRAGNTNFGGEQYVLTSSDGGAMNVTATSGTVTNNNTGTVTVTPSTSASTFTFTYTGTTGSRTISVTNNVEYENPAAYAVEISGAAAGGRGMFKGMIGSGVFYKGDFDAYHPRPHRSTRHGFRCWVRSK